MLKDFLFMKGISLLPFHLPHSKSLKGSPDDTIFPKILTARNSFQDPYTLSLIFQTKLYALGHNTLDTPASGERQLNCLQ